MFSTPSGPLRHSRASQTEARRIGEQTGIRTFPNCAAYPICEMDFTQTTVMTLSHATVDDVIPVFAREIWVSRALGTGYCDTNPRVLPFGPESGVNLYNSECRRPRIEFRQGLDVA